MKHLFIITQCQYTLKGINCVLQENDSGIEVHIVQSPWEIIRFVSQGIPAKDCVVLIVLYSLNARARTHALWFAWTFHRLLCDYIHLRAISRFIMAEPSETPAACRFWTRICPGSSVSQFRDFMMSAMQSDAISHYPANAYKLRITPREKQVLAHIQNGVSDEIGANQLHVSRTVFSLFRTSLIKKFGLKSRFDFAWLHGMEFR